MAKVVTITNPVTGQPAQVDQLDHTAQQIDDAVEAARWSHRNLLDNAYWANPDAIIDQRGGYVVPPGTAYFEIGSGTQIGTLSTYSNVVRFVVDGSTRFPIIKIGGVEYFASPTSEVRGYVGAGYTIDRWKVDGTLLIQDGCIVVKNTSVPIIRHFLDNPNSYRGKVLTFSVQVKSALSNLVLYIRYNNYINAVIKGFSNIPAGGVITVTATVPDIDLTALFVQCASEAVTEFSLQAAKLELGSQQTLAHQDANGNWVLNDPPPDPALELLKCMRYQQKIENISSGASIVGWGMVSTTKEIIFSIPLSAQLRNSTPTVIFNQAEYSYGAQYAEIPSNATISGIRNNGNSVQVVVTFPSEHGISISAVVGLRLTNSKGAYVLIDNNL